MSPCREISFSFSPFSPFCGWRTVNSTYGCCQIQCPLHLSRVFTIALQSFTSYLSTFLQASWPHSSPFHKSIQHISCVEVCVSVCVHTTACRIVIDGADAEKGHQVSTPSPFHAIVQKVIGDMRGAIFYLRV